MSALKQKLLHKKKEIRLLKLIRKVILKVKEKSESDKQNKVLENLEQQLNNL